MRADSDATLIAARANLVKSPASDPRHPEALLAVVVEGELVEDGETGDLFTNPQDERTQAYITGRFG